MPKIEQKQVVINEIKGKLDKAVSVVLVDARGVTVEQDTVLRRKFREADVDYKVYKNSMLEFAVKDTQFEGLGQYLVGPTTIALSYGEATAAAAIIAKESKTVKALEFKAGFVDGVLYDAVGIETIANIPPKEELLSRLLGSFKSPMSTFARLIDQVAQSKAE
ncbi:MAG: 50S ribosomal protein L10 [Defluviitaleaceae bacterium]|nr:50S ribosomal protein L10 [Defluviitaleaceae bacterium]